MMMWYMINEYRRKCGFDSLLLEIGGIDRRSGVLPSHARANGSVTGSLPTASYTVNELP